MGLGPRAEITRWRFPAGGGANSGRSGRAGGKSNRSADASGARHRLPSPFRVSTGQNRLATDGTKPERWSTGVSRRAGGAWKGGCDRVATQGTPGVPCLFIGDDRSGCVLEQLPSLPHLDPARSAESAAPGSIPGPGEPDPARPTHTGRIDPLPGRTAGRPQQALRVWGLLGPRRRLRSARAAVRRVPALHCPIPRHGRSLAQP
jgi:hypothetical protein